MFNLTKLKLLWEKLEEITARLRSDEKRLPPDYSTEEIVTGQKWTDGNYIYQKIIIKDLPEITQTTQITVGAIDSGLNIIDMLVMVYSANGSAYTLNHINQYNIVNGNITSNSITSTYSEGKIICTIKYTKPDPVPGNRETESDQLTEVKKTRKTKKEEETK